MRVHEKTDAWHQQVFAMLGVMGYGDTHETSPKDCNLINPRHELLPREQQVDVIGVAIS